MTSVSETGGERRASFANKTETRVPAPEMILKRVPPPCRNRLRPTTDAPVWTAARPFIMLPIDTVCLT